MTERQTAIEWAHVVRDLVGVFYPDAERLVPVQGTPSTHGSASPSEAFRPDEAKRLADELELRDAPTHGNWLNSAEMEVSILSRQCRRRRGPDRDRRSAEVAAWTRDRDAGSGRVDWRFTTDDAHIKRKRRYPSLDC